MSNFTYNFTYLKIKKRVTRWQKSSVNSCYWDGRFWRAIYIWGNLLCYQALISLRPSNKALCAQSTNISRICDNMWWFYLFATRIYGTDRFVKNLHFHFCYRSLKFLKVLDWILQASSTVPFSCRHCTVHLYDLSVFLSLR